MHDQRARDILQMLVEGNDPFSGEELAESTVLQEAEVIRALLAGVNALDANLLRASRRAALPQNIGTAWTAEEQAQLVEAFEAGEELSEVADRHGRTLRAIEARLEKLGLLSKGARATRDRFGPRES